MSRCLRQLPAEQAGARQRHLRWHDQWQIEKRWYSVRDVTFGEDACQVHSGHALANLAVCPTATLKVLCRTGVTSIAAALRRQAMYAHEALATLGINLA